MKQPRSTRASIPSVAYTDPEIAWVGLTETEAKAQGHRSTASASSRGPRRGRAIGIGRTEGFTKLIFDEATTASLGAGIVGVERRRPDRRDSRWRSRWAAKPPTSASPSTRIRR